MRCVRKIESGDITPAEAADQMRLTLAAFAVCLPSLLDRGFPPADPAPLHEIEAALAVQMACTHMVAMAVMSRIEGAHGGPNCLSGLASATSKLRAFSSPVDTLRRFRSEGDQNIRVEHVHVHEGAQAIVGTVNSRSLQDGHK
jgi:hypothetical protein